jgi:basic membrane lipoprotein Med (substrate-binding protein (PBP1-ABC) superfamily)
MTRLPTTLAAAALAVAGAGCAQVAEGTQDKVVVVLGGRAARSPALIERAQKAVAEATGAEVQLRVPQTATEELGVTHLFAARRYDTVIAVDLDARVSVAPVAERYPDLRFVATSADAGALERAVAAVSD